MNKRLLPALFLLLSTSALAEPYRKPAAAIDKVLRAPSVPYTFVSPTRQDILLATPIKYPPIAELAQPMLRLAGVRVLPRNRGLHAAFGCNSFDLVHLADGSKVHVPTPAGAKLGLPSWSPDGKRFAFTLTTATSVDLYLAEVGNPKPVKVRGLKANPFFGPPVQWMPDSKNLLVREVPVGQGKAPDAAEAPAGPNIQETSGNKGASSTYEVRDTLKGLHDEALFDYYGQTQLAFVDSATGKVRPIGKPGLYSDAEMSPDGQHLLIETVHRPYSYLTTLQRFPKEVDIWDVYGKKTKHIASVAAADHVPTWGCETGPREFSWRSTAPATLIWAEALDGGNFKTAVPFRDKLVSWAAPFSGSPREVAQLVLRYNGAGWLETGSQALVTEVDPVKHWQRETLLDFDAEKASPRLLWEQSTDEHYKDHGTPVYRSLPNGEAVIQVIKGDTCLRGVGGSPDGDRPFLDMFDLQTGKTERLFRSGKDCYDSFACWLDPMKGTFVVRHETPTEVPNLYVRTLGPSIPAPEGEASYSSTVTRQITHIADPTPEIRGITKRLVTYKRADGVDLSFTLFLPPGYQEGTRLPAVLWAYPLDYTDPKMAGQVTGSTKRFTTLPIHQLCLLDGYAVIDSPSLPVIGDSNKIYDTYMEQLIAGAQACVDKAVEIGVVDRNRIGITGHSHGGLMTVNLLTHTDLFRAGVARSGAYNRSLTAFGFQNERRTVWEAPEVYFKVSPFFHADKLKKPVLLIHGEADANPGTVPLQSQALFEAIRGNGGTARLVMLPHESHGYSALESNEQVVYEMLEWFDRYVKNAPGR